MCFVSCFLWWTTNSWWEFSGFVNAAFLQNMDCFVAARREPSSSEISEREEVHAGIRHKPCRPRAWLWPGRRTGLQTPTNCGDGRYILERNLRLFSFRNAMLCTIMHHQQKHVHRLFHVFSFMPDNAMCMKWIYDDCSVSLFTCI